MAFPGRGAALLLLAAAAPGAFAQPVEVRLSQPASKTFEIQGSFEVQAGTAEAWEALTDYGAIPDFVSSMRLSRVLERRPDGSVLLEQEAAAGVWPLSRRVRLRLEVRRAPGGLSFRDIRKKDFKRYQGGWEIAGERWGGVRVSYRLHAEPRFFAPGFLARRQMRNAARELLEQVRAEILRRASRVARRP